MKFFADSHSLQDNCNNFGDLTFDLVAVTRLIYQHPNTSNQFPIEGITGKTFPSASGVLCV